jgi:type II secretory pathway pseudopilin PulG
MRCGTASSGFSLLEAIVAAAVIGIFSLGTIEVLLTMNRNAARIRVMNMAKAAVLEKVQDLQTAPWLPQDDPPVVPAHLLVGKHTEKIDIGDVSSGIGEIPATLTTTVTEVPNEVNADIRRLEVVIDYTYLGRPQTYSVTTMRAPDKLLPPSVND